LWEEQPLSVTEVFDRTIRKFSDPDIALADYCGQVTAETSALHGASHRKLHSWLVTSFITSKTDIRLPAAVT
jgi:hypothetical protein